MADRDTKSRRENPGLRRQKQPDDLGRHRDTPRPRLNQTDKAETAERQRKAAAEALVQLHQIIVVARTQRASEALHAEKPDLFTAWYQRRCEREKARRNRVRQESAFALAVVCAVSIDIAYLCGVSTAFHRFASGWELLPILFGSLVLFSVLFYKMLGRRRWKR